MESSVFRFIWRFSRRDQLLLLAFTAASFPFLYYSLDLPKTIINQAIGGTEFPRSLVGLEFGQIQFLMVLCAIFLSLVFINGGFKYFINVFQGILAERMLRRLRFQLIERTLRFPQSQFRNLSQGEVVAMVTTETEPLGGFFGEALALPAFQGGTLITILAFILIQDPILGLAAIALYPVQAYIIPKLQRQVNQLGKERVRTVRKLSERLSETVAGIQDVHANATYQYELADFSDRLGQIFNIRYRIYRKKFFIKFLNNFLAQLTPFFFFSIGGYLVIQGDLSFGALVAVLAAYKDLSSPWKELLTYYQRMEDSRIKYDQLAEQFAPPGMLDETLIAVDGADGYPPLDGRLQGANLMLEDGGGDHRINGATLSFDIRSHVGLLGDAGSGRSDLARLLAGQIPPSGGQVTVDGQNLNQLPRAHLTREITYVDQESTLRSGSILENLLYGLRQRPLSENRAAENRAHRLTEALASGNSTFLIDDDWLADDAGRLARIHDALRITELEDDVFEIGLRSVIDVSDQPEMADRLVRARARVHDLLRARDLTDIVEVFDSGRYMISATVAENILWGTPVDDTFATENLCRNGYLHDILARADLLETFVDKGRAVAGAMIELFSDLPPGHEFFERFGFFHHEQIPDYQRILNRACSQGTANLAEADSARLIELTLQVVMARHNLFEMDRPFCERVLHARGLFTRHLPAEFADKIDFFDVDRCNAASTIQDNILFGKVAVDKAEAANRASQLLTEVVDETDLRASIIEVGLRFDIGIGGKRLTVPQRRKLTLARALLKQPRLLVANKALAGVDPAAEKAIVRKLRAATPDRGILWVADGDESLDDEPPFARTFVVERGKVREMNANEPAHAAWLRQDDARTAKGLARQADVLAQVSFFSNIDRSTLKLIAFTSERLTYAPGDLMLRQGDVGTNAFVILDGAVEITVNAVGGEMRVAELGSGEMIGELALLCEVPRTANVKAVTRVEALSISKDIFTKVVLQNSAMATELSRLIASRLISVLRAQSKRAVADSDHFPTVDQDVGLPNALLFEDRKQRLAAQEHRRSPKSSIVILRWEGPEMIPGEDGSQQVPAINLIAERVRPLLRDSDTLAKINHGRALGILAYGTYDGEGLRVLKDRIADVLGVPLRGEAAAVSLVDGLRIETAPVRSDAESGLGDDVDDAPAVGASLSGGAR